MEKSKVYFTTFKTSFTENIPDKLKRLILTAGIRDIDFTDKYAAIKIHFGELNLILSIILSKFMGLRGEKVPFLRRRGKNQGKSKRWRLCHMV